MEEEKKKDPTAKTEQKTENISPNEQIMIDQLYKDQAMIDWVKCLKIFE